MKELLFSITKDDFIIHWFSGTGSGGQHRNKHQNCCRLQHPESGASSTGQSSRSREDNLREAFKSIIESPKFKTWYNQVVWEKLNKKTIEELVAESMVPKNLKVEARDEKGKWFEWEDEEDFY